VNKIASMNVGWTEHRDCEITRVIEMLKYAFSVLFSLSDKSKYIFPNFLSKRL